MESKTKSKVALGLILGVAAGAAVYYFMTNEDGKQQLSNVIDAVKDFSDKAKTAAVEQSSKLADKASDLASTYASKASDLASEYISKASDATSKLAEDAQKQAQRVG
ncbi:YtxH domain-containing protein [Pedobacter arcticus]|uniref:YtxH domain-containing protein n=1 Tax=Pedobacter arcticus TaxID=752140 RepID=UPI0002F2213E|nr:YtxH domain-containing protein [Pedobacter arcticus]